MARNLLALPVLCLLAIGFASADEPERIVGGIFAEPGEYPFAVSIQVLGNHFCGGAIISENHILTAAHCLVPLQKQMLDFVTVRTGTNNKKRGGQSHKVSMLLGHPSYDDKNIWLNDIGIIKLAAPIKFNRFQKKIEMPTAAPEVGATPVIVGWGRTGAGKAGKSPNSLMKISLKVISQEVCQQYHEGIGIFNTMICTLNRVGEGTCSGDSGSPLVLDGKIVGVVSGGIPCAVGFPDVFTNVFTHLEFVNHYMQF